MQAAQAEKHIELDRIRDTVESIWVAFVAAFVLRAFLFEAFVIPTGSMAPRLLGEHWDLICPACGYEFAHGKPKETATYRLSPGVKYLPAEALCPSCGFHYGQYRKGQEEYLNSGDRVLVLKYLYTFRQPKPWDVVVFKNPQDNRQNFIKRLVGLPGETIEIVHGDIFYRNSDKKWRVRRKPPKAQEAMWQVIYDNDYRPNQQWLAERLAPRWDPPCWLPSSGWDLAGDNGRVFEFKDPAQQGELVLNASRWEFLPRYGYNSPREENVTIDQDRDICTDLKLEFTFVPESARSRAGLELTSFEHRFRAEVSGDGNVSLLHRSHGQPAGQWQVWAGPRKVRGISVGRGCHVAITHADFLVTVWVNGRAVVESTDQQYPADYEALKARLADVRNRPIPTPQVRITADGGPCQLRHVKLMRDVYYTCPQLQAPEPGPAGDYARAKGVSSGMPGWGTTGNPITLREFPDSPALNEYFCLGDNSPQSLDGRQWVHAAPTLRLYEDTNGKQWVYQLGTVPRYNLIGKAFFVYWPSAFRLPGLSRLPMVPNVGRMRLIR